LLNEAFSGIQYKPQSLPVITARLLHPILIGKCGSRTLDSSNSYFLHDFFNVLIEVFPE
jgi:hypothetical protein